MSNDSFGTSPDRIEALHRLRDRLQGESSSVQSDRLLQAIRELGSVSTFEAMRYLDIYDPRPRKLALVRAGHKIVMTWRHSITESGQKHRIGVYSIARTSTDSGEATRG